MLDFHNVLWVIPGLIFIYLYNRFRPDNTEAMAINLSGWPYLFLLVFIAAITWFPSELIVELFWDTNILIQKGVILSFSVIFVFIFLWIAQCPSIARQIFLPVQDNFYKKCVEWENKEVLITLNNGKTYQGLLWKYPESPKSRHESQTISIVPFKSGYRDEKTKKVIWNTYYPEYEGKSDLIDMEIIIPRTGIITFGKFSSKTFEYFEKQKSPEHSQST